MVSVSYYARFSVFLYLFKWSLQILHLYTEGSHGNIHGPAHNYPALFPRVGVESTPWGRRAAASRDQGQKFSRDILEVFRLVFKGATTSKIEPAIPNQMHWVSSILQLNTSSPQIIWGVIGKEWYRRCKNVSVKEERSWEVCYVCGGFSGVETIIMITQKKFGHGLSIPYWTCIIP